MTDGRHFGVNFITGQHNAVKCVSEAGKENFWTLKQVQSCHLRVKRQSCFVVLTFQ